MKILTLITFTLAAATLTLAAANLEPTIGKRGKKTVEDDFAGGSLGKGWTVVKGDWRVEDGALSGAELAADKHAAVLHYAKPNTDSIVGLRFKFDGASAFHLSFNRAKGHLLRLVVSPDGLALIKDKNKKDPKSKPLRMSEAKGSFEAGRWHSLLVEVVGEKVVARTDNKLVVTGSHPEFRTRKPNYRFIVQGERIWIDDFRVWGGAKGDTQRPASN